VLSRATDTSRPLSHECHIAGQIMHHERSDACFIKKSAITRTMMRSLSSTMGIERRLWYHDLDGWNPEDPSLILAGNPLWIVFHTAGVGVSCPRPRSSVFASMQSSHSVTKHRSTTRMDDATARQGSRSLQFRPTCPRDLLPGQLRGLRETKSPAECRRWVTQPRRKPCDSVTDRKHERVYTAVWSRFRQRMNVTGRWIRQRKEC
jgi:hypothetical protein